MMPGTPTANDVTNALISLDETAREMEAKWGVGRLVRLVSPETRASFQRGWTAWRDAQAAGDYRKMLDIIPKMARAWRFMDAEAAKAGHPVLSPVVWEVRCQDGSVIALVRTTAEAHAVAREGRDVRIWTMDELANVLPKYDLLNVIKDNFPGAVADRLAPEPVKPAAPVEKVVQLSHAYAESWATHSRDHLPWFEADDAVVAGGEA